MNPRPFLDRLHARARGALTRAEEDELERELARDPELRALAEDYELVFTLTRVESSFAASRTPFETLEPRLDEPGERRSSLRPVAAAAILFLVAGAAFFAGRRSRPDDEPLLLRRIELNPRSLASSVPTGSALPAGLPADLPSQWVDYDPRGAQGVRFLSNLNEAEQLARAVQRPLLVYGSYPGCPLCAALDAHVFSDPRVIELSERTVPVRVNLADLSPAQQRSLTARGYPFLEMWRDDGSTTHSLTRMPDAGAFLESLHDGLEQSDATGELPPWEGLRDTAARFQAARAAELAGRIAEAERGFRSLSEAPECPAWIATLARNGIRRLSERARELLLEARAAAASDLGTARGLLEDALERFGDSSFAPDIRAALERLELDGRFPRLAEADHSA